jgi:hemolysin D
MSSDAPADRPGASRALVARPTPKPVSRRAHELQFLPAALEIIETPASPLGRAIGGVIIAFFCVALAWAWFGRVDIVATAPGKIVPTGHTKVVQPFEIGVVKAIYVRDGQSVTAGQVLIELDSTVSGAERDRLQSDLTAARLEVARLNALLAGGSDPLAEFHPPADADPAHVAVQRQYLLNQSAEHDAKIASLDQQRAQKLAERAAAGGEIGKIQALIPLLQQQVDMHKKLFDEGYGTKLAYIQGLQALIEQQRELVVQKSNYQATDATLAAIGEARNQAEAEYRHDLLDQLEKAQQKVAELTQDLIQAGERARLQRLTAPVDGVVQQLAVHTLGGVVTPAQALLSVVPADNHLEIEAVVSNRDIGFVHAGDEVEIKVETFNFTRYGLIHGRVLSVSQDAVTRDNPQDQANAQAPSASGAAPQSQEPVYLARISLDRIKMQVEDKLLDLSPGMAVTAEIRTGSRRIIDFLLSPLRKYTQEGLRER